MADGVNFVFLSDVLLSVNFAMYSFSGLVKKCRKKSVSSRSKNEMEYAIIFIFHKEKWFVVQSTVLKNVIKMETRELNLNISRVE